MGRRGAVRRVLEFEPVERIVSTALLGRLLDRPAAFVARQLSGDRRVCRYHVAATHIALHLQHNTPDVQVIDEIFYRRLYEPRPSAAATLERSPHPLRVVDLGANIGLFGVWLFGRYPDSTLVAVEPDARNSALLDATIRANGMQERWRSVQAAAATAAGSVAFAGGNYAVSHVVDDAAAPPGTVRVPAIDVFSALATADLVKIDIEGGEWELIADPRFRDIPARVVVVEYHPERCPQSDPHRAAALALQGAGFAVEPIFQAPTGVGMAWAWRRDM